MLKNFNQSDPNKELFIELSLKKLIQDHFKSEKNVIIKQYVKDICIINPYFKFSVDLEPGEINKKVY